MKTPKWALWLWEKVGKKLQPAANEIQSWEIPEWAKPLIIKAEKVLVSAGSMVWMKKFALDVCEKYDDKFAKDLIDAVLGVFTDNEE